PRQPRRRVVPGPRRRPPRLPRGRRGDRAPQGDRGADPRDARERTRTLRVRKSMSALPSACSGCPMAAPAPRRAARTIAVVGPPNAGKSTLFNRLTGLRQKVANYPGVTVEKRVGRLAVDGAPDAILVDLP